MTPKSERSCRRLWAGIRDWRVHISALGFYALCSIIFIDHDVSITRNISGGGSDPFDSTWFLSWWPWAISHHIDPLFTKLVWYPVGVSLAWITSVPILAMIGWPITAFAGSVVTYNLLIIIAPVLSAWGAYFLCFRLTSNIAAALVGGYLFGFSSYEMAQETGALNLSFTCALPVLLLVVIARVDGRMNRELTVFLMGLVLIFQFLVCIEIFAFIVVFGSLSWIFAVLYFPDIRDRLGLFFVDSILAGSAILLAVSPFLVSMWRHESLIKHPAIWPYYFTADLANVVIPGSENLFGRLLPAISGRFAIDSQEQDAYIGLPLAIIIWRFSRDHCQQDQRRFLLTLFGIIFVASLGPTLWFGGVPMPIVLPWAIFVHLPLLGDALPARFALFVSLVTAVVAAFWIAAASSRGKRLAFGVVACVSLFPQPHPWMKIPYSEFFKPAEVTKILGANARILILPFGLNGPSSYWQQESQFNVTQTGGYLGFPPAPAEKYLIVQELFGNFVGPHFDADLSYYCRQTKTQYVVIGSGTSSVIMAEMADMGWEHQEVDDVIIYKVPIAHG